MPAEQLYPNCALTAALALATTSAPAASSRSLEVQEEADLHHQSRTASPPSGSCRKGKECNLSCLAETACGWVDTHPAHA